MSSSRVPTSDYCLCSCVPGLLQLTSQKDDTAARESELWPQPQPGMQAEGAKTRQDLWLVLCWGAVQVGGFLQLPLSQHSPKLPFPTQWRVDMFVLLSVLGHVLQWG